MYAVRRSLAIIGHKIYRETNEPLSVSVSVRGGYIMVGPPFRVCLIHGGLIREFLFGYSASSLKNGFNIPTQTSGTNNRKLKT